MGETSEDLGTQDIAWLQSLRLQRIEYEHVSTLSSNHLFQKSPIAPNVIVVVSCECHEH